MKEISCKLLVDRRRSRRLCLRHPRRPARHRTVHRRGGQARRHLPERRLHPVQGADPCRRGVREDRHMAPAQDAARHLARRARARPGAHRRLEGRHRRPADQRRRRPVQEGQASRSSQGWARFRDGKTVEVETETGTQVIRAETVVIATGSAPVELPFLPFGGTVISSTEALALTEVPETAGGRRRRLYRAGARHRLREAGRRRSRSSRRCRASCRTTMPS